MLRLIVKGQRMKEIGAALRLSTRTVESHKYDMMQALGLHSTAELVRYAIEQRPGHRLTARPRLSVLLRTPDQYFPQPGQ